MTIYLDAVWTLNILLDMMLLMLTKALARDQTNQWRLLFGAFIASLIVPFTIYFPNSFLSTFYGKILYSIFIILCTFKFRSIYQMMKLLALFYFTSFIIGGGLIAVHFLFYHPIDISMSGIITFQQGYGDPISWLFVIIGFPIVWLFTKRRMDKHLVEKVRFDQLYPVSIRMHGKHYSTTGYIDSGNQLVDPLTKHPVVICDEPFLRKWFTEEEWRSLRQAHETLTFDRVPKSWQERLHVIPYHGVEGKNQFLMGLKPDEVIVTYQNTTLTTQKVLIGMQFATLTKDHMYHCLLHPQLITKYGAESA